MAELADAKRVEHLVGDLADRLGKLIDRAGGQTKWAVVGIRRRGDVLARRLADQLGERVDGRVGSVDITLYRDDLSEIAAQPVVRTTEVPFDIAALNVVLVDDVLMSGRSVRAALQSLMDLGRPRRVWLCVLIDRGGRELPIAPDLVALDLSDQAMDERVQVHLTPIDEADRITLEPAGGA
jgi:pyrimidine operon attenuation protein/uracil phosphoribosyltransferase